MNDKEKKYTMFFNWERRKKPIVFVAWPPMLG